MYFWLIRSTLNMSCYQLPAKYKRFRALKLQLSFPLFVILLSCIFMQNIFKTLQIIITIIYAFSTHFLPVCLAFSFFIPFCIIVFLFGTIFFFPASKIPFSVPASDKWSASWKPLNLNLHFWRIVYKCRILGWEVFSLSILKRSSRYSWNSIISVEELAVSLLLLFQYVFYILLGPPKRA